MAGMFTLLKWVLTGDVLRRVDTQIGAGGTLSLRLKRDRSSGVEYVVLALTGPGNYRYYPLELEEFDRFLAAAKDIRAAARSRVSPSTRGQIT